MITESANYSLLSHNTFGIDVKAKLFLEYTSVEELKSILARKELITSPFLHIGAGSNLLFISDYKGVILHSLIKGMEVIEETDGYVKVRVGSGEVWDDFVEYAVENNWYGAENLSGIPGEVGASAVQNIGAYGVEIKDILDSVETIEIAANSERIFSNDDCYFSYRQSIFKNELKGKYIVTHVVYRLSKKEIYNLEYGNIKAELANYNEVNLHTVRKAIISIREAKLPDPKVEGNGGSFFMNPIISRDLLNTLKQSYPDIPFYEINMATVKLPAAWIIDQCGWKGKRIGNAGVHDKQALVLVNKGGATGEEIIRLSKEIQASVKDKFGIDIHPEVNFIGDCI